MIYKLLKKTLGKNVFAYMPHTATFLSLYFLLFKNYTKQYILKT